MKLTLKKIKFYDDLSEETICFTAELYADGKKAAEFVMKGDNVK